MSDNSGYLPLPRGFATASIHAGKSAEHWESHSIIPPIVMSTTFKQPPSEKFQEFKYGREGNPTRNALEKNLAAIEGAEFGLCFSSGLASVTALMGLLGVGDHILSCDDLFGGSFRLLSLVGQNAGLEVTFVDTTNLGKVENAIKPNTKLIFVETPSNPTLKVTDLEAISKIAKINNIFLAVDNTFLTPYFQRPLGFGADVSMYSITKYMNGHSDVIMGALLTNSKELHDKLRKLQMLLGNIPSPFDCALVIRSLTTLALRMKQHQENSIALAMFLENHPRVIKVLHPGLPSHPQYELCKRQTSGHSGMMSIYIDGGLMEVKKFLKATKLVAHAGSLGGLDTTVLIPNIMSSKSIPAETKKELNITDNLIRISVGVEDIDDIIEDLNQALNAM